MPLLVEVHSGPNHWLGTYGSLLVIYWLRDIDPSVCRRLPEFARKALAQRRDSKTAVLSISVPGVRPPMTESRQALVDLFRDTDGYISRVAVAREEEGFVASIVSSVVAAIQMLAKPEAGHRSFTSLDAALPWVTAELGDPEIVPGRFAEAVTVIRRQRDLLNTRFKTAS